MLSQWVGRSEPEAALDLPRWAFPVATALALTAVWAHEYPAGVDLPQHAHLIDLWTRLGGGAPELDSLYEIRPFTPYLVPYGLGYFVALAIGPLPAVKCLLSLVAVAWPVMMTRWLKAIGAEPAFGLLGFPLAFGFTYLWGFVSHGFAMPIVFGYLAAFESQYRRRCWRSGSTAFAWGLLLFFSHGIAFAVTTIVAATSWLAHGSAWRRRWTVAHLIPLGTLAVWWLVRHRGPSAGKTREWFLGKDRLLTLFSGAFVPEPDVAWACVSVAILAVLLVVARPRIATSAPRVVPCAVALTLFVVLPEWLASTWLVGTRMLVFVHAFFPAWLVVWRRDALAKRVPHVVTALTVGILVLVNVRLTRFNEELDGLRAIEAALEPTGDIHPLVPEEGARSAAFGAGQHGQAPAWLAVGTDRLVQNDFGRYFQSPIRRKVVRFPRRHRYVVSRGNVDGVLPSVADRVPDAKQVGSYGEWLLFEQEPQRYRGLEIVRTSQSSGTLHQDRSLRGTPLRVRGKKYRRGLGTSARSFVRLEAPPRDEHLRGKCGVDDACDAGSGVVFRVRADGGAVLWQSPPLGKRDGVVSFSVSLPRDRQVVLETDSEDPLDGSCPNWLGLRGAR